MTNKRPDSGDSAAEAWPALPLDAWRDTCDTLHMWTQVVGKVKLELCPFLNEWWEVPLELTARGLTTSTIPCGRGAFEIAFDFIDHNLYIRTSDGALKALPLMPRSVADFYGPKPLGRPPDPTTITASPRPDWYFLWYFTLFTVLPHAAESYVIVLAPLAFGLALVLLPIVASRGRRSLRFRPWAVAIVAGAVGVIAWFWPLGVRAPWSPDFEAHPLSARAVGNSDSEVVAGAALFYSKGCEYCHTIAGQGGERGPDLSDVAHRLNHPQLVARVLGGGPNMPAFVGKLSPAELGALIALLESRRTAPR